MTTIDQKWVLPLFIAGFLVLIGLTNLPASSYWYDSVEDYQINKMEVTELADWIIQGSNRFVPVLLQEKDDQTLLDNIPGVIQLHIDSSLEQKIKEIPSYKTWVIITKDGTLSNPVAAVLTKDWQRRVVLLKGGAKEWNTKITAKTIDGILLSPEEQTALNNVRSFFQGSSEPVLTESEEQDLLCCNEPSQERYVAPAVAEPPLLEEEEEEEEEGC
ncbi:MAG: hypothetical protein HQM14_03205 [SAR324 cluster bacterium]|nr:hypothetical protein [SAR324 cluster bacterium]